MRRWIPDLRSLSLQMILSFVVLVLLTAVAAGLPAIWLIRDQIGHQAWAQVEQGSLAAQALYEAKLNELQSLSTLTAQRPTLRDLLVGREQKTLSAYLHTLQEGSGLDLVLVCDIGQEAVAYAGDVVPGDLCLKEARSGFHIVSAEPSPRAWLLAAHPLDTEAGDPIGMVYVGVALDDQFAMQMRAQTGLEHSLLVDGHPVASSLTGWQAVPCATLGGELQNIFFVGSHPYYATCLPLDGPDLQAQMALDVTDAFATQPRLIQILVGSILAVAVLASLLGIFMARRIGQPLTHLAEAADTISQGDLDTPLVIEARVREVTLLAHALEGAREDLKRTLAELRREKAWTDHLLGAIVEGIVTLDRQGHITFFSHGAERITGWRSEEVVDQGCDRVFKPVETDAPFSQLIPAPGRREKISVEMRDGRQAILAITGARLLPSEGDAARVALVFRDVSETEAIHRLLGHFLANVAHEFRTPLSALAASVELLMDQAPDLSAAELEELLTSLHLGVLGLQTLIDNLLESASIEAGHFRVHPRISSLDGIMAEAIRTMQPLLDKRGQDLVVELPTDIPKVRADPRRTTQVLVNLLSNASKYGPDETEIEVGATVQGDWIRVTVADSGSGVPPEYRNNLFRRFARPALSQDKAQVGAGLGLSVVKAVVEAHGGSVGVDDHVDGGSVFWFTLPRAAEQ
jgi:two-component system phosphate regulon sensor histidine kinase PhoR